MLRPWVSATGNVAASSNIRHCGYDCSQHRMLLLEALFLRSQPRPCRLQAQGTIRQRIKRVYKAKPGKVTIRDLLAAVPSRREQGTWTFAFAVTWLAFTLPPDSDELIDCLDYMAQRGRYSRGCVCQVESPRLCFVDFVTTLIKEAACSFGVVGAEAIVCSLNTGQLGCACRC
jgi:hypothetical protein